MVAFAQTVSFAGLQAIPIEVQVHLGRGLPGITIVGLAEKSVTESRERIKAALHSLGIGLPPKRMTINLSPADVAKEGSHYDLPIGLAILAVLEVIDPSTLENALALAELSLDGRLLPVPGILPAAWYASSCGHHLLCDRQGGQQARWLGEALAISACDHLRTMIQVLRGEQSAVALPSVNLTAASSSDCLSDIRGHPQAKRVLEIAAAGGHHCLMIGPPGVGKTMLASRLTTILPRLNAHEALETSMIHSVAGTLEADTIVTDRPFRHPHHTASVASVIGGGGRIRPGEISLAHHGVLFLDELPEFPRSLLDALRQPLETRKVVIARAQQTVTFPANFQLIAAMNPCICGHLNDPVRACRRAPICAENYLGRISGPLLDRFDLIIKLDQPGLDLLTRPHELGESSELIRQRVEQTRQIQRERQDATNAEATIQLFEQQLSSTPELERLYVDSAKSLQLTARGYHRTLRVARTIADLTGCRDFTRIALMEALSYRAHHHAVRR